MAERKQLMVERSTYLHKHGIRKRLEGWVEDILCHLPEDPIEFLQSRLEAEIRSREALENGEHVDGARPSTAEQVQHSAEQKMLDFEARTKTAPGTRDVGVRSVRALVMVSNGAEEPQFVSFNRNITEREATPARLSEWGVELGSDVKSALLGLPEPGYRLSATAEGKRPTTQDTAGRGMETALGDPKTAPPAQTTPEVETMDDDASSEAARMAEMVQVASPPTHLASSIRTPTK